MSREEIVGDLDGWIDGEGGRWFRGKGGGTLIFRPDGTVAVRWIETAALASAHASGNRGTRMTESTAPGMPPGLSPQFLAVADIRLVHEAGLGFPEDHKDAAAKDAMSIYRDMAWKLLRAVATGDAEFLREAATHTEAFTNIRTGKLETPMEHWQDMADAISEAAREAGEPPRRSSVLHHFNKLVHRPENN